MQQGLALYHSDPVLGNELESCAKLERYLKNTVEDQLQESPTAQTGRAKKKKVAPVVASRVLKR